MALKTLCTKCETLPSKNAGPGTLYIRPPLGHTAQKIMHIFKKDSIPYTSETGILNVTIDTENLDAVVASMVQVLSKMELKDTLVLFQKKEQGFQLSAFFDAEPLSIFSEKIKADWLCKLIEGKHLYSAFQPIVDFRNNNRLYAYECLLRAKQGEEVIMPAKMFSVAKGAELMFQLDLAARFTAVTQAAKFNIQSKLFINFSPNSIYDPVFCLNSTLALIDKYNISREQIVFEVVESESIDDMDHLLSIFNFYKKTGFKIALDDVGAGFSNLNLMTKIKPDYIKLDIGLIKNVDKEHYQAVVCRKIIEAGRELGTIVLAEGIETAEEYAWCTGEKVDLGQGFYFAKPGTPPPILSPFI